MKTLAVIPARGGSKGIPYKNIINLGGRPLIAWTIQASLCSNKIAKTVVSTEDRLIGLTAVEWGAHVIKRPTKLSHDDVHASSVVLHALHYMDDIYDAVAMLLPTSPFRIDKHIDDAVSVLESSQADSVVSVSKVKPANSLRVMRKGRLVPLIKEEELHAQRQEAEEVYGVNGAIFIAKVDKFMKHRTFHMPNTQAYLMGPTESLDINEKEDLALARDHILAAKVPTESS